jgi:hypothetical protein
MVAQASESEKANEAGTALCKRFLQSIQQAVIDCCDDGMSPRMAVSVVMAALDTATVSTLATTLASLEAEHDSPQLMDRFHKHFERVSVISSECGVQALTCRVFAKP